MNAKIEEKDGKLYVEATTTLTYGKRFHTYKNWDTSDVIQYIKEHHPQYSITSVIKGKGTFISNYRHKFLRGEWVFSLTNSTEQPETPATSKDPSPAVGKSVASPGRSGAAINLWLDVARRDEDRPSTPSPPKAPTPSKTRPRVDENPPRKKRHSREEHMKKKGLRRRKKRATPQSPPEDK